MRRFLFYYFSFCVVIANAQTSVPWNATWGHYYSLEQYDRHPNPERKSWDAYHFKLIPGDTRVEYIDRPEKENPVDFKIYSELMGNGSKRAPYYLSSREAFTIADPPANSSDQTKAELNYLLQLQTRRSTEDIRASQYYATVFYRVTTQPGDADYTSMRRNLFHIGRSIATWFCADSLPVTAILTSNVWKDASYVIWKYKNYFVRIRPYKLEPKLKNLEETNWAAYPSGHATNSYTNAYLFSLLLPEFSSFFLKDAYDMAHSREILGVHYPSDSESGRLLGKELIERLMLNPGFKQDFEKAKTEIHAMKAKHGYL